MNKRFWVNMIIGMMATPVDILLVYVKAPIGIRSLCLGVALACCINGIVSFVAERQELKNKKNKINVVAFCDENNTVLAMLYVDSLEGVESNGYKIWTNLDNVKVKGIGTEDSFELE